MEEANSRGAAHTVLITGASSGIGKACALHLDRCGYTVFAGVRNHDDGAALQQEASERLHTVRIDVTDDQSISEAVAQVEAESGGVLHGLINNAGIGRGGALEVIAMDEIRAVFDVNVLGLIAVTKAFLPMLQQGAGRLVNIGSTASFLAVPGASVYSASKFAVRALSDSLRTELHPFAMHVILVAPGAVESSIWEKGRAYKKRMREGISPEVAKKYSDLRRFGEHIEKEVKKIPAQQVAEVVETALKAAKPKPYYLVGPDARGAAKVARMPKRLVDWMIRKRIDSA